MKLAKLAVEHAKAQLADVDRAEQRKAREVLQLMVETGQLRQSDLDVVATPSRDARKALRHLTVGELVDMGIVHVIREGKRA